MPFEPMLLPFATDDTDKIVQFFGWDKPDKWPITSVKIGPYVLDRKRWRFEAIEKNPAHPTSLVAKLHFDASNLSLDSYLDAPLVEALNAGSATLTLNVRVNNTPEPLTVVLSP